MVFAFISTLPFIQIAKIAHVSIMTHTYSMYYYIFNDVLKHIIYQNIAKTKFSLLLNNDEYISQFTQIIHNSVKSVCIFLLFVFYFIINDGSLLIIISDNKINFY